MLAAVMMLLSTPLAVIAQADEDTENPGNIEKLTVTPLDSAAKVEWSGVEDNVAVDGYFIHYGLTQVKEQGEFYSLDGENPNFADAKIPEKNDDGLYEFTVENLDNDTTYYFSIVAYDEAGNESGLLAPEAEVIPTADAGDISDEEAPKVTDAEALNQEEVKVVFSEPVVLPAENAQDEFTIENDDTFESLNVLAAIMDASDAGASTVILTTEPQEELVNYKLEVGTGVKDRYENPISSGTSDTALFVGSGEPKAPEDKDAPALVAVEAIDATHIRVDFNEGIVLGIDPAENFVITSDDEVAESVTVLGVELSPNSEGTEDSTAILTTSPQGKKTYILTVAGITDEAENELPEAGILTMNFEGKGETGSIDDLIPPKDAANFIAEKLLQAEKYLITLKWKVPAENAGDAVEQILYLSRNKGDAYSKQTGLEPAADKYEAGEFAPGEYWFKLTQKDEAGNESEGSIAKVVLAETGPGVAALILVSLGLGRLIGKKRK